MRVFYMVLFVVGFLFSSCTGFLGAVVVDGVLVRHGDAEPRRCGFGENSSQDCYFIELRTGSEIKKVHFSEDAAYYFNGKKCDLFCDTPLNSYSMFTNSRYPRKIKLFTDDASKISRIETALFIVDGHIKGFDSKTKSIKIRKNDPDSKTVPVDDNISVENGKLSGPLMVDLPTIFLWDELTSNALELKVRPDTKLFLNYKPVPAEALGGYIGKQVHFVLDEKRQPQIIYVFDYDDSVRFYRAACTGYILSWANNYTQVKIWKPKDIEAYFYKINHSQLEPHQVQSMIDKNEIQKDFNLVADWTFAKDTDIYIQGERVALPSLRRTELEVDECLFYGPTYISFNPSGKISTLMVSYLEAE